MRDQDGGDGTTAPPPTELELKFAADADVIGWLRDAPAITKYRRDRGTVRHLRAIYFDTVDHALLQHGLTLRVRRAGRRHIQTLKKEPLAGSPLERPEWEVAVPDMTPDLSLLPPEAAAECAEAIGEAPLAPVVTTRIRRDIHHLELPDATVEMAIDTGTIETEDEQLPVSEVELELTSGSVGGLARLALDLIATAPLRLELRSKAERGFSLIATNGGGATKAFPSLVRPGMTLDSAIAAVLAGCQHHLLANQKAISLSDPPSPEAVHQARVALRRLRTAFGLFGRHLGTDAFEPLAAEAKAIADRFSGARRWDVFLDEGLAGPLSAFGGDPGMAAIRERAGAQRAAEIAAISVSVLDQGVQHFHLRLMEFVAEQRWKRAEESDPSPPAGEIAGALVAEAAARLLKRGRRFKSLDDAARHRLRIAAKKLRYTIEFLTPVLDHGKARRRYLDALAALQDALGVLNDLTATEALLGALVDPAAPSEIQRAAGVVAGWHARERHAVEQKARKAWRRFRRAGAFW